MNRKLVLTIAVVFALFTSTPAWAWGEIGHLVVALVASKLVKNPQLKKFLKTRGNLLGHVANIPDIYWRGILEAGPVGAGAHFINPHPPETDLAKIPLSWKKFVRLAKQPEQQVASELGSLWWRADQFYRRGVADARAAAATAPDSQESKDAITQMLIDMGLMAHFTGDASMPFHNTTDYDGYEAGHGGIHSYYEELVVEALGLGLSQQVLDRARGVRTFPRRGTLLERIRALSLHVARQIPKLLKLDRITAPSDQETKTFAKRPSAEDAAGDFGPYIIDQLARSAVLTAQLWDEMYAAGGSPDLTQYKHGPYPLEPPYVAPDYLSPDASGACPLAPLAAHR
jgi:hypothetical protein